MGGVKTPYLYLFRLLQKVFSLSFIGHNFIFFSRKEGPDDTKVLIPRKDGKNVVCVTKTAPMSITSLLSTIIKSFLSIVFQYFR